MNKYRNKKVMVNQILFDSKAEAEFYLHLLSLQKSGIVKKIELQPKFELQQPFVNSEGKKRRGIYYISDFCVEYENGMNVIIDVKGGVLTKEFNIKRRIFEYRYPDLKLVLMRKERGGWNEITG